ncbi:MAG: HEAT repeat domain-containing protein [Gammaproteobacteria bacterium]|nr:HEAT repeat domain-containing protein [Gammaproteobacteria bacterium]
MSQPPPPPDALLFIAPGCHHCPVVLAGLAHLMEDGLLGTLEVVNVAAHPERARELGVRAAPWTRLGPFELEGLHDEAELRHWAGQAVAGAAGMADYLRHLLGSGRRGTVTDKLQREPRHLGALVLLLGDLKTSIDTRLGIMATLEELAGEQAPESLVEPLGALTRHAEARVRTDACHALGLTASTTARPYLEACLADDDDEVREAAAEAMEAIEGT